MRVLIDSNIVFSAMHSKGSIPHQAFYKAIELPNQGLICEQSFDELRKVFTRKNPEKLNILESFFELIIKAVEVVPVPETPHESENKVRDIDDRNILRAAIAAKADMIISGDKDLLDSGLTNPKIITASQFMRDDF